MLVEIDQTDVIPPTGGRAEAVVVASETGTIAVPQVVVGWNQMLSEMEPVAPPLEIAVSAEFGTIPHHSDSPSQ